MYRQIRLSKKGGRPGKDSLLLSSFGAQLADFGKTMFKDV